MQENGIDIALITDDDSVYYFTGYYDYLHMEFGRPTILVIPLEGESLLITPSIDYNTALDNAATDRIEPWNDGMGTEWRAHIPGALAGQNTIAIEPHHMPPIVREYINTVCHDRPLTDITPIIAELRMIKSEDELQLARHAGEVATAMMQAGRDAIDDGVPEFEVALATSAAGTRKSSQLLNDHYKGSVMSPNTHFLQIMASGEQITRTHHRASNRVMQTGEPVFLCFCGMTNFHRFKLGFDRTKPRFGMLLSRVDHVNEQRGSLEVSKKLVTEADPFARSFKEPRHVGYDELATVQRFDSAENRRKRGERVLGHLGFCVRDTPKQRRLPGVGKPEECGIAHELESKLERVVLAG